MKRNKMYCCCLQMSLFVFKSFICLASIVCCFNVVLFTDMDFVALVGKLPHVLKKNLKPQLKAVCL